MNILFFLTPKSDVAFIYSDANLREAIDLMEAHRYSALPILEEPYEPEFKGYGADLHHGSKAPSGQQPGKCRCENGRSAGQGDAAELCPGTR